MIRVLKNPTAKIFFEQSLTGQEAKTRAGKLFLCTRQARTIIFMSVFTSALVWALPPVQAKTVSVKEIIKLPTTEQTLEIPIQDGTFPALPKNSQSRIALEPLFLTQASLLKVTPALFVPTKDPAPLHKWVTQYANNQNTHAENARMATKNGRVVDFSPGKDGLVIDTRATSMALLQSIVNNNSASPVVGFTTKPTNALADTNTLGIRELLASGISDFSNSSKNRQANIEAGMQQVKGALINPGETFSFGKYLGDVTAEKGFKPEIVIKAEGLRPELGGGICQVSSTLFRAVMASGMPITQRKNHAFSVSHYFPVGTDATIYTPATDLKFVNDTPAQVLVWAHYLDQTHLAFDLYGTNDGRNVVVDEPIQWDRQANGAVKASWTRHVTKNGQTRDDTIKSNYLPPAMFKKEEKFVVASPANTTNPTPTPATTPSPTSTIETR